MFASLRSRLWSTYVLLALVILLVVALGLFIFLIRNPVADRQDYLNLERVMATLIRRTDTLQILQNRPVEYAQRIDSVADVRVLILASDHSLLVDSRQESAASIGPLALNSIRDQRDVALDQSGKRWLTLSRRLDNGTILVLATPRPGAMALLYTRRIRDLLREDFIPPFMQAGCLALFLALILAFWMSRWISAPLGSIAAAARKTPEGTYETIQLQGPSEVRNLARAFNDMTQRVRASQQSQREFVANVSHELKTPLTSIQGFSQAIMDGAASAPEDLHQAASIIHTEATRMHRLVLNLLDLARFDAGMVTIERTDVNLQELLKHAYERYKPNAEQAKVGMSWHADDLANLSGDGEKLAQVLGNLVENALKHTPAGGQVVMSAQADGEYAEIKVSDSGTGIPEADLPRIFERFYQVDKSRIGGHVHGSGLGLAIAKEIIHAHGGSIVAQNNHPQGSLFVVRIPFGRPLNPIIAHRKA